MKSFIWLQEDEESGKADCGCLLERTGQGPRITLCPKHAAADALLEACIEVRTQLEGLATYSFNVLDEAIKQATETP